MIVSAMVALCVVLGLAFAQTRSASQSRTVQEAPPQAETTPVPQESPSVGAEKITLRLVDSDSRPVAGAKVARTVRVRETSVLGSKLDWEPGPQGTTDDRGQVILKRTDVFLGQREKGSLYILHEEKRIGAVCEIARADPNRELVIVLNPICRVRGRLDSAGLAAVGMPLRQAFAYVLMDRNPVAECSLLSEKLAFEFPLPPGEYTLRLYGSSYNAEDPATIAARTKEEMLKLSVPEGKRDLDLGVVNLGLTKISSLIGHPAPEIGPIKTWKNGSAATLAQLRGQYVWLHFSGEYPSTSRDLPKLVELHEAFSGKGVTIIAIFNCASMDELEQRWTAAYQRYGGVQDVPFRIAIDGGEPTFYEGTNRQRLGATYGHYDITGYPTDVLIDPAGNVIGQPNGMFAKETISKLLGAGQESPLAWRQRFNEVYRLADGEVIKRIAPPFIAERMDYYRAEHGGQAAAIPGGPQQITFYWDGRLRNWGMGFGSRVGTLGHVLSDLGFKRYEYDGSQELLDMELPGDWIIRDSAPREAKVRALQELIARELGREIRFEKRSIERDVILAAGAFKFHPPVGTYENSSVHLYATKTDLNEGAGGGTANSVSEFLQVLGNCVNMPVIDQTEASGATRIPYHHHHSAYVRATEIPDERERAKELKVLLDHLTAQTELQFETRKQPVEVWLITEERTVP